MRAEQERAGRAEASLARNEQLLTKIDKTVNRARDAPGFYVEVAMAKAVADTRAPRGQSIFEASGVAVDGS